MASDIKEIADALEGSDSFSMDGVTIIKDEYFSSLLAARELLQELFDEGHGGDFRGLMNEVISKTK